MTVREAVSVLKSAKAISLFWGEDCIPFDTKNDLLMDAFGSYKVAEIEHVENDRFTLVISARPAKESV